MEGNPMSTILAAIDNSAAAQPVLSLATTLGKLLGSPVEVLHVSETDQPSATAQAEGNGLECETMSGDPLALIVERAGQDDISAVVIGAPGRVQNGHVGHHLPRRIADAINKRLLVVPLEAKSPDQLHRVVIAIERTDAKARHLTAAVNLAKAPTLDIAAVLVVDEESIPSFSDQAAHGTDAYTSDFLARCGHYAPDATFELRIGVPADEVLNLADSVAADMVAVGWPNETDADRRTTARDILDRSHIPVLVAALPDRA